MYSLAKLGRRFFCAGSGDLEDFDENIAQFRLQIQANHTPDSLFGDLSRQEYAMEYHPW